MDRKCRKLQRERNFFKVKFEACRESKADLKTDCHEKEHEIAQQRRELSEVKNDLNMCKNSLNKEHDARIKWQKKTIDYSIENNTLQELLKALNASYPYTRTEYPDRKWVRQDKLWPDMKLRKADGSYEQF